MTKDITPTYHELEMPVARAVLFHRAAREVGIALAVQRTEDNQEQVKIGFFNLGGQTAADAMFDRVAVLEGNS